MNNDFNFKPNQPQNSSQTSNQTDTASNSAASTEPVQTSVQPSPADQPAPTTSDSGADKASGVVVSKRSPGKLRKFFGFLGLLLLLAAVAGGVWYWQQTQIKELNSAKSGLESEVSALESKLASADKAEDLPAQAAPAATKPSTVKEIVTGNFVKQEGSNVVVNALYLPGEVEEIWVEVGTKPGEMSGSTKHLSEGLGAGTAGKYAKQEFGLIDLKPATTYFYWTGAKVDGKNVYGGVSSFETAK